MSGWIEWSGIGVCPVRTGAHIELKFRSGKVVETHRPEDWLWGRARHSNSLGEIIAYRVLVEAA